jgi:hypothetical protein
MPFHCIVDWRGHIYFRTSTNANWIGVQLILLQFRRDGGDADSQHGYAHQITREDRLNSAFFNNQQVGVTITGFHGN